MGNAYSSQPQLIARFTIRTVGNSTRVFAAIGTSMQNAFGRADSIDLSKGKAGHQIQGALQDIKAQVESSARR